MRPPAREAAPPSRTRPSRPPAREAAPPPRQKAPPARERPARSPSPPKATTPPAAPPKARPPTRPEPVTRPTRPEPPPDSGPSEQQVEENEAFCAANPDNPKCGGTAEPPPETGRSEEQVQENEAFCAENPDSPKCGGTAETPPPATEKVCEANPKYPGCDALAQPDLGQPEEDGQIGSICEQNPLLPQCQASQETAQPDVPSGRPDEDEPEEAVERPDRDDEDGIGGPALPPPLALEEGEAPPPPRTGDLPGSGPPIESPTAPPSVAGGEESCPEGQAFSEYWGGCACTGAGESPDPVPVGDACVPAAEVGYDDYYDFCLQWAQTRGTLVGYESWEDMCTQLVEEICRQIDTGESDWYTGSAEDYAFCREDDEPETEIAEQECAEGQVSWGDQCVWPGNCPEGQVEHLDYSVDPPTVCLQSCPEGMVDRAGSCIGVSYCVQQGGITDEGQCVLECPSGQIEEAGACVVAEACPEGTEMQGGSCQPTACQLGEVPVEGVCRPFAEVGYEEFIEACAESFSETPMFAGSPSLGSDYSGISPERRCQIAIDNACSRAEGGEATPIDLSGAPVCEDREPACDAGEYLASDGSCTASCGEGEYVLGNGQCASACQPPYATIGNECRMGCPAGYDFVQGEQNQCVAGCPAGETRLEDGTCGNPCPEGQVSEFGQCREACPEGQSLYFGQCQEQCPDYNGPHTPVNGVCVPEFTVPYEEAVQACQDGDVNFASASGASDRASCEAAVADSCQAESTVGGEREKLYCYEQAGPAPNGGACPEGLVGYSGACISACPPGTAESGGQCEPVDEPPDEEEPPVAGEPPEEDEPPVAEGPPAEDEPAAGDEQEVAEGDEQDVTEGDEQDVVEGECPEGQLAVDGACRPLTEVGYDEAIESCLEGGSPGWPAMNEDSCAALVAEVCSDIGAGSASGLPGSAGDYPFCAGPPADGDEPPVAAEPPADDDPPVAEGPTDEAYEPPYAGLPPIFVLPPRPPVEASPPGAGRPPPLAGLPPEPDPAPPAAGEPPVEAAALAEAAGDDAPRTAPPQPLAVVIANAAYQHGDMPGRPDALANATEFVRFLKEEAALPTDSIVPLADGALAEFEALFGTPDEPDGDLQSKMAAAETSNLLIYFSGHAIAVDSGRDAVLLAADSDLDDPARTGYRLSTLYRNLAELGVERLRVFIDASFGHSLEAQPDPESAPAGSVVSYPVIGPLGIETPPQWVVLTAGTGTQPTYEDPGAPRSAFTDALIAGLGGAADAAGDNDGASTAGELAAFVRDTVGRVVAEATGGSQTPALFGDRDEVLMLTTERSRIGTR